MNRTVFFIGVCAGFGAFPVLVSAEGEEEKPPGIISGEYLETLDKRLDLQGDQKNKIKSVLQEASPAIKKDWEEMSKLKKRIQALGKKMREDMRKTHEKVRSQLTDDQREKFDEMRVEMRRRMKRGKERRRPGPPNRAPFPDGGSGSLPERIEQEPFRGRDDMPSEIRERIIERRRKRERMRPGEQRDVPPVGEWNDRERGFFKEEE